MIRKLYRVFYWKLAVVSWSGTLVLIRYLLLENLQSPPYLTPTHRSCYIDILYANIMPILECLVKPAIFSDLLQSGGSKFDTICPVLVRATVFLEGSQIPTRNEPRVHIKI